MKFEDDLLDYYLSLEPASEEAQNPATEGQLSYIEYLLLDAPGMCIPKQVEQHVAFLGKDLTAAEAASVISLLKQFEPEPVNMSQKDIGKTLVKRVPREP